MEEGEEEEEKPADNLVDLYNSYMNVKNEADELVAFKQRNFRKSVTFKEEENNGDDERPVSAGFTLSPGDPGFNAEATRLMHGMLDVVEANCELSPTSMQPYQRVIQWLVHPSTPIRSLLVAHRTGSGKTREMILVLDNFYTDPRPKYVIFPTENTRDGFYSELMFWENRYKQYVLANLDMQDAEEVEKLVAQYKNKVRFPTDLHERIVGLLGMEGHARQAGQPGYLASPLRAYKYNEAARKGGRTLKLREGTNMKRADCLPINGVENGFCNAIVLMDEAHNLAHPGTDIVNPMTLSNLKRMEEELYEAQNAVKVLFTATPIQKDPSDVRRILRAIKGRENEHKNDEGFVSAFYGSPAPAFVPTTPNSRALPRIVAVTLNGDPNDETSSLGKYLQELARKDKSVASSRERYEYASAYNSHSPEYLKKMLKSPATMVPKVYKTLQMIMACEGKVLVITSGKSPEHGFFHTGYLAEHYPEFAPTLSGGKVRSLLDLPIEDERKKQHSFVNHMCNGKIRHGTDMRNCTMAEFDHPDNDDGSKIKALVLNGPKFGEGANFLTVRTVIMLDIPVSWAIEQQRVGRAVRFCSHKTLPLEKQHVDYYLLVATLPPQVKNAQGKVLDLRGVLTIDEERVIAMIKERDFVEGAMCELINIAVDREILLEAMGEDQCSFVADLRRHEMPILSDEEEAQLAEAKEAERRRQLVEASVAQRLEMGERCMDELHNCQSAYRKTFKTISARYDAHVYCSDLHDKCLQEVSLHAPPIEHEEETVAQQTAPQLRCPLEYSPDECRIYCGSLGERSHAHMKCLQRNGLTLTNATENGGGGGEAVVDGGDCPNCAEGASDKDCLLECKSFGVRDADLYRCIARTNNGACINPRTTTTTTEELAIQGDETEQQQDIVAGATKKPAAKKKPAKRQRRR